MKYIEYNPKGNTVGVETDFSDYWEIDQSGRTLRSITIRSDQTILRYDEQHDADEYGVLPEGLITEENLTDPSCGQCTVISKESFETIWIKPAINRK